MKRSLVIGVAVATAMTALAATPSLARERSNQGGIANPNNLTFLGTQRTMRQQALVNEMRQLRREMKAEKARNGGMLPEGSELQQRLDALKAEYRQAG